MTTWMIAEIPASGDDFSFIFSRTKKLELVCRRFDGSLTLEWTENTARHDGDGFVRLSCGSRTGEFDTWSTDLCPDIPQVDGDVSFSANAAELLERINRVAYATLKPGEGGRDASAIHRPPEKRTLASSKIGTSDFFKTRLIFFSASENSLASTVARKGRTASSKLLIAVSFLLCEAQPDHKRSAEVRGNCVRLDVDGLV